MKRILIALLLSSVALAQSKPLSGSVNLSGGSFSANLLVGGTLGVTGAASFSTITTTGNVTVGTSATTNKLCLGTPCSTYFDTPGGTTTLNLVLNGWSLAITGSASASAGFNGSTANPTFTNTSNTPLRIHTANALLLVSTAGTTKIGNGSGDEADGALATGSLTVGTSGTSIGSSIRGTATLDFASALVTACSADLTIPVTGAVAGTEVVLGVPNASVAAGSDFFAWVSATDTVSVRHCCGAGASCDPASGTFAARVFNP